MINSLFNFKLWLTLAITALFGLSIFYGRKHHSYLNILIRRFVRIKAQHYAISLKSQAIKYPSRIILWGILKYAKPN